jgi:hypothetical protein
MFLFSFPYVYCFIKTTKLQLHKFVPPHSLQLKVKNSISNYKASYFLLFFHHFYLLKLLKKIMAQLCFDLLEGVKFELMLIFILLRFK